MSTQQTHIGYAVRRVNATSYPWLNAHTFSDARGASGHFRSSVRDATVWRTQRGARRYVTSFTNHVVVPLFACARTRVNVTFERDVAWNVNVNGGVR